MTNSNPEFSQTLSHSPKPRMRILCFICRLPSDVINWGPSPMLYLVDYPPRYINWAAPTIDIFKLFVDYPPVGPHPDSQYLALALALGSHVLAPQGHPTSGYLVKSPLTISFASVRVRSCELRRYNHPRHTLTTN